MNRVAIVVGMCGVGITIVLTSLSRAQDKPAPFQQKTGLVDMAEVFKRSDEFVALRMNLKSEITKADLEIKKMTALIQQLQTELKTLDKGSDEYGTMSKGIVTLTRKLKAHREDFQGEFLRKEAEIYQKIYEDSTKEIERYARQNGFTLILRYNGTEINSNVDPKELIQQLNRQVVYSDKRHVITQVIVDRINKQYQSEK